MILTTVLDTGAVPKVAVIVVFVMLFALASQPFSGTFAVSIGATLAYCAVFGNQLGN